MTSVLEPSDPACELLFQDDNLQMVGVVDTGDATRCLSEARLAEARGKTH